MFKSPDQKIKGISNQNNVVVGSSLKSAVTSSPKFSRRQKLTQILRAILI